MLRLETFPKEIVKAFYNSFEKIAPVRVLMKIAKPEDLIPGLPKNVMTKSWLSQELVLSEYLRDKTSRCVKLSKLFFRAQKYEGFRDSWWFDEFFGIHLLRCTNDWHTNICRSKYKCRKKR